MDNVRTTNSGHVQAQPFHFLTLHTLCMSRATDKHSTLEFRLQAGASAGLVKKFCAFYGTRSCKIDGLWQTTWWRFVNSNDVSMEHVASIFRLEVWGSVFTLKLFLSNGLHGVIFHKKVIHICFGFVKTKTVLQNPGLCIINLLAPE